jgi:hypothetical protein
MTPTNEQQERQAFEKWARPIWRHREDFDQRISAEKGVYNSYEVQAAWCAWQAARAAATQQVTGIDDVERKELAALRELAAGRFTLAKVVEVLGPMSLWSQAGIEAEFQRRYAADYERGWRAWADAPDMPGEGEP